MLFRNQKNHIGRECGEEGSIAGNLTHPDKSGLPNLIARLAVYHHRKDFDSVPEHLSSNCLPIGAGSDVSHGAERIAEVFWAHSPKPAHLIREPRVHLIAFNNPFDAIVVGIYTIYSDTVHMMFSFEMWRPTVDCRWDDHGKAAAGERHGSAVRAVHAHPPKPYRQSQPYLRLHRR